jgi:hypothetical protein
LTASVTLTPHPVLYVHPHAGSSHCHARILVEFVPSVVTTTLPTQFVSIMKPTWCTFRSTYWESIASACFEPYLLILRRCYTNIVWYIACV